MAGKSKEPLGFIETNILMRHEHVKMQGLLREATEYLHMYNDLCDGHAPVEALIKEIDELLENTPIELYDFGVPKDVDES